MDRVIFLDRDGTINKEVNYLYRPEDLVILDGVAEAVRYWNKAGYRVVVVTNQAGVARGYYGEEDVKALHSYLNQELERLGAHIDHFFYCPHHPVHGVGKYKTNCSCRKPKPGLLLMAEHYYEIDKKHSYLIGDTLSDIQAGKTYGIKNILVGTGYGRELHDTIEGSDQVPPYDYYAGTMKEAADWIRKEEKEDEQ